MLSILVWRWRGRGIKTAIIVRTTKWAHLVNGHMLWRGRVVHGGEPEHGPAQLARVLTADLQPLQQAILVGVPLPKMRHEVTQAKKTRCKKAQECDKACAHIPDGTRSRGEAYGGGIREDRQTVAVAASAAATAGQSRRASEVRAGALRGLGRVKVHRIDAEQMNK